MNKGKERLGVGALFAMIGNKLWTVGIIYNLAVICYEIVKAGLRLG